MSISVKSLLSEILPQWLGRRQDLEQSQRRAARPPASKSLKQLSAYRPPVVHQDNRASNM